MSPRAARPIVAASSGAGTRSRAAENGCVEPAPGSGHLVGDEIGDQRREDDTVAPGARGHEQPGLGGPSDEREPVRGHRPVADGHRDDLGPAQPPVQLADAAPDEVVQLGQLRSERRLGGRGQPVRGTQVGHAVGPGHGVQAAGEGPVRRAHAPRRRAPVRARAPRRLALPGAAAAARPVRTGRAARWCGRRSRARPARRRPGLRTACAHRRRRRSPRRPPPPRRSRAARWPRATPRAARHCPGMPRRAAAGLAPVRTRHRGVARAPPPGRRPRRRRRAWRPRRGSPRGRRGPRCCAPPRGSRAWSRPTARPATAASGRVRPGGSRPPPRRCRSPDGRRPRCRPPASRRTRRWPCAGRPPSPRPRGARLGPVAVRWRPRRRRSR